MIPKLANHTPAIKDEIKLLIYGDAMVGKTTFANTFPKPLFISTDGNTTHLTGEFSVIEINPKVNVVSTKSGHSITYNGWEYFLLILKELEESSLLEFETIVIDSIYDLYEMCVRHFNSKSGIDDESELPFGKGFTRPRRDFASNIIRLRQLSHKNNLVAIVPSKIDENGAITHSFPQKVWNSIARLFGIVGCIKFIEHNGKVERALAIQENRLNIPFGSTLNDPSYTLLKDIITNLTTQQPKE